MKLRKANLCNMENELFDKFKLLGLNDKRNEFNGELLKIHALINEITKAKGYQGQISNIINYNLANDKNISEDEYLFLQYQNLINIRKSIVNYISWKE